MSQVAVVVGAGPGTGGSVARKFAKEGFSVALVTRSQESSRSTYDAITKAGGKALVVTADTGKEEDVKAAYKKIVDELGASPSVLVYNAGARFPWPPPSILDVKAADYQQSFQVGAIGALFWIQQVLPEQLKAGKGTILLSGATASLRGGAKFALLANNKAALRSLGQSVAREFQPKGIHVAHVILDGVILTERTKGFAYDKKGVDYLLPDEIAEQYWNLHTQHPSVWTQELDLRPLTEKF